MRQYLSFNPMDFWFTNQITISNISPILALILCLHGILINHDKLIINRPIRNDWRSLYSGTNPNLPWLLEGWAWCWRDPVTGSKKGSWIQAPVGSHQDFGMDSVWFFCWGLWQSMTYIFNLWINSNISYISISYIYIYYSQFGPYFVEGLLIILIWFN